MAKVLEFQLQHQPPSEYLELISFRVDWFDHLAVQGTLKSPLQHHSLKASILWCLAFFMVQHSDPYISTGKSIVLTIQTFVSKVISLLFNMLSRFVVALSFKDQVFFNFMVAVTVCTDFGAQEKKIRHCFQFFSISLPWSDGTGCHDLSFLNVEFQASFSHSALPPSSRLFLVFFALCH